MFNLKPSMYYYLFFNGELSGCLISGLTIMKNIAIPLEKIPQWLLEFNYVKSNSSETYPS